MRVVVVGGGLAGLSAAESLACQAPGRYEIHVLEAKQTTGGRAGSFSDPSTDQTVDYCQHVAMGCCTNLVGLLDRCGMMRFFQRNNQLRFLHPRSEPSELAPTPGLPAPFHFAFGLTRMRFLTARQRRRLRLGMWRLCRMSSKLTSTLTAEQWLRTQGQSLDVIRDFWNVFSISALGDGVDRVSIGALRKVIVDGFIRARGASDLLIPSMPLGHLFGCELPDRIRKCGVMIHTSAAVRCVHPGDPRPRVERVDGQIIDADHVIVAVPWHRVSSLVSANDLPEVATFAELESSPITGVHLWLDRQLTLHPYSALAGTLAQWVFCPPWRNTQDAAHGFYHQVVISGSRSVRAMSRDDLTTKILDELCEVFPAAQGASVLRSRVVTDPNAVFSPSPQSERVRPPARTRLPWLHLAGDWVATGWPATMEGAVIGGRMASQSVIDQSPGTPIKLSIDPGLPSGWLAKRIIRDANI